MWTCKICETKNNNRLECCCICHFDKSYSDSLTVNANTIVDPNSSATDASYSYSETSTEIYDGFDIVDDEPHDEYYSEDESLEISTYEGSTAHEESLETTEYDEEFVFNSDRTILRKYNGTNRKVRVPHGVKIIGISCFEENKNIEIVSLPHTVTNIAERAFANCTKLVTVSMSCSLSYIMENAFLNCISLSDFLIPDCIKIVESTAFTNCGSLRILGGRFSQAKHYAKKYHIPYKVKSNISKLKESYCTKCGVYVSHFPNVTICTNCEDSYW